MLIEKASLDSYNAVVVFRELRFTDLLRQHMRQILSAQTPPLVTEVPGQFLAVVYPHLQIECQFGNRRLQVTDRRGLVGQDPFCEITVSAVQKTKEAINQEVVAHGLNYDVSIPLLGVEGAGPYVANTFLKDPARLEGALGGLLREAGIKVTVKAKDCEVNFDLEKAPPTVPTLHAHVNYHFEGRESPSDSPTLKKLLEERYEDFLRALGAL